MGERERGQVSGEFEILAYKKERRRVERVERTEGEEFEDWSLVGVAKRGGGSMKNKIK